MAMKSRYMTGSPRRVTLVLDSDTLRDLDQIAPDNIGEAVRFCIQHALAAGAVFRATVQHTAAQCRKHQQRYPDNAEPLPTTYGGHVMTVRPAPEPAQAEPTQPATVWTPTPEPAQVAQQPVATQEPTVIRGQPLSAAALAAVAAVALTDDEIKALDPARGGAQPFIG